MQKKHAWYAIVGNSFRNSFDIARQQTANIDTLICHAELSRSPLEMYAEAIAAAIGIDPARAVVRGEIKTRGRIEEKARRYDGRAENIRDICRCRLLIDSPRDVLALRSLFIPGKDKGFHAIWSERSGIDVIEFEDFFLEPPSREYIGINIVVAVDLGKGRRHLCEIQVVHRDMRATLDETHILYETLREIKEAAKAEKRAMTAVEKETITALDSRISALHLADAYRYNLYSLRKPEMQAPARHAGRDLMAA